MGTTQQKTLAGCQGAWKEWGMVICPLLSSQATMCQRLHPLSLIRQPSPIYLAATQSIFRSLFPHLDPSSLWEMMASFLAKPRVDYIHKLLLFALGPFSCLFKCAFWFLPGPCLVSHLKTEFFFHFYFLAL